MTKTHIGTILSVKDGILLVQNLDGVGMNELVEIYTSNFESIPGLVVEISEDFVGIITLGDFAKIKAGDQIKSTGKVLSLKVSEDYLGRVIDALGNPLDGKGPIFSQTSKIVEMPLEKIAAGVIERDDVQRSLETGILAIDALIPIGRGQRQLIIGDRQTGKTSIAIDTMINLKDKNCISIYISIGQKVSKLSQLIKRLEQQGALNTSVIISAPVSSSAAMQYIAAFTGTAIGEYFAENGKDALVIYDDLSKHAQAYREISLLLGRPSGRDAYPGDIFYLHSRLLERALQYSRENKGGSLTALPIIETQAGDIAAYIPTNIISITDGQIFLDATLFNSGQRPAVNVGNSVSRVGGAAQTKIMKQVAGQLKLDLAQYRELAAFAQFGTDLDSSTQERLDKGALSMEILKQPENEPYTLIEMVSILYALNTGVLTDIPHKEIPDWISLLRKELAEQEELLSLDPTQKIGEDKEFKLREFLNQVTKKHKSRHAKL